MADLATAFEAQAARVGATVHRVPPGDLAARTIAAMLALGFTTRYSGLDATMGLAFARTGVLYPLRRCSAGSAWR